MRPLQREQEAKPPFVFTRERAGPFATAGFARMMGAAGDESHRNTRTRFATPGHLLSGLRTSGGSERV